MESLKVCGVCGDKALGFNFNALTCESCKAFFRRNALRNKNFRCMTAGNCVLNPKTRKYCRRCRLNKCFQIGMKKEWILTEEEKVLKRRKHRNHHHHHPGSDSIESNSSYNSVMPDADSSSSMNNRSPNDTKNPLTKIDPKNNNIIILPVLPLSIDCNKDSNEIIQSLNINEIINYINQKLELNLSAVQMETSNSSNSGTTTIIICADNFDKQQRPQFQNLTSPKVPDDKLLSNTTTTTTSQPWPLPQPHQYYNNETFTTFSAPDSYRTENGWTPACCNENNTNGLQGSTMSINDNDNILMDYNNETNNWCYHSNKESNPNNDCGEKPNKNEIDYEWRISDNIYKHAIQLEYTRNPLRTDDIGHPPAIVGRKLNELEEGRLREVNEHFNNFNNWNNLTSYSENNKKFITDIQDSLKYFELDIKRVIIAVKNIRSFKIMCQEDQIVLLKGSASEIKILQNIRFFQRATPNGLLVPDPKDQDSVLVYDTEMLRQTYGDELLGRCHKLVMSFRLDWQEDNSIINVLAMILLFYPNRTNLLHPEYVTLEYFTYCHLLQRYLEVKYSSVCEAKTIYLNLMSRLEEIHELNDQCMDLILKLDPKYIGPLTIELLAKKIPSATNEHQQLQQTNAGMPV